MSARRGTTPDATATMLTCGKASDQRRLAVARTEPMPRIERFPMGVGRGVWPHEKREMSHGTAMTLSAGSYFSFLIFRPLGDPP